MKTNEPRVGREHLTALAQKCDLLTGYRTAEMVDAIIGYAYVVLNDKAVQEAVVKANPRPTIDAITREVQMMKELLVEARQSLDTNSFALCAWAIDAALKVGALLRYGEGNAGRCRANDCGPGNGAYRVGSCLRLDA